MTRKFIATLAFIALGIAVAGMACIDQGASIDKSDETDGAT